MGHLAMEEVSFEQMKEIMKKQMNYTDEEFDHVWSQPKFQKTFSMMPTKEFRDTTLVLEVVESHGCSEGMKVGDKLYFTGMALLDTSRSSKWCAYALSHATSFAFLCHNMMLQGIDPNEMYSNHCSCFDAGCKYGLGQVIMKAYTIKEDSSKF